MFNVKVAAKFWINNRTDFEVKSHEVDVTDDMAEMMADGVEFFDAKEYVIERTGEKLGWMNEADFIEWDVSELVAQ